MVSLEGFLVISAIGYIVIAFTLMLGIPPIIRYKAEALRYRELYGPLPSDPERS